MVSLNQFEVIISKQENLEYKATSNLFPRCFGQGKTEKEALKKLSSSISRFIARNLKISLEQLLCSDNYTEIILDSKENANKEHRVFTVDQMFKGINKQVSLKIKSSLDMDNFKDQMKKKDGIFNDFSEHDLYQIMGVQNHKEEDFLSIINKPTQDGLIFGLPISFN